MYKRILVLTDNAQIYSKFNKIVASSNYPQKFSFFCSKETNFFRENSVQSLKIKTKLGFIIDNFDLVISLHCKQIFPSKLIEKIKCINVHPGYNPINRGWYPQIFAIIYNLPIGATIHEMDEKVDHGPIIDRVFVKKYEYDTSLSLYNRVLDAEIELVRKNLKRILDGKYRTFIPESEGNLFLINDFNKLKEINLNKKTTYKEVIDYLSAMTHGDYNNAYFIDSLGNKIC
jgi:methionyl-tRNA formyltransferase